MIFLYSVSDWRDILVLEKPRSRITLLVAGTICLAFVLLSQFIKGKHWCYLHADGLGWGCFLLCLAAVFGALYSRFPDRAFTPNWILVTVLVCIISGLLVFVLSDKGSAISPGLKGYLGFAVIVYLFTAYDWFFGG